jgi:hypothetical protein
MAAVRVWAQAAREADDCSKAGSSYRNEGVIEM